MVTAIDQRQCSLTVVNTYARLNKVKMWIEHGSLISSSLGDRFPPFTWLSLKSDCSGVLNWLNVYKS